MALELKHIKGNSYYIPSGVNVGLYVSGNDAILIDSGNDKDFARQVNNLIESKGWKLKCIINTHSNADHIGGNAYLQNKTGCKIMTTRIEGAFTQDTFIESAFLYGGFPFDKLQNKLLMAKPSVVTDVIESSGEILDTKLEAVSLPGHFFDMIGVKTPDGVFYVADSIFSKKILDKYHISFIFDVKAQFETLQFLKNDNSEVFVPCHANPTSDLDELIVENENSIRQIISDIFEFCVESKSAEDVLKFLFDKYELRLDEIQYVLNLSSVRSYLSYMLGAGLIEYVFFENRMLWKRK